MATNVVFNGVTYSVPAANEEGWQSLSNYLIALAGASVSGGSQSLAVRIAGTATVTAATSDAVILINFAGAVTVNLPAGVDKQILWIGDISGAAETNNITINRAGTNTIFGGTSYTLNQNNQVACFIFSVANGNWNRVAESKLPANGAAATLLKSDGTKLLYAKLVDADVATAAAIARSKVASGTANHVVINDGTGVLSSEAQLAVSRGGTGLSALGSAFQSLRVNAGGTALEYSSVGTGDVTGPASSINNGVVVFSGTTGKVVKNSSIFSTDLVLITGNQTIGGIKTFSSGAVISATTNQLVLGTTNTVTITSPAPAASRVHTIPDVPDSSFVMSEGAQSINGAKTFASSVTISPTTNQIVFGVTNTTTITSPAPVASRVYTIPDAGGAASFVMNAGTNTIAGTLTLPATVSYTSAGSIVKSGVGALTITNASAAGLTFAGTGTVSAPTGTYTLAGLSLGNVFTVAQTISAATNQIVLGTTNTTTINSAAPAASRTYNIIDAGGAADFVMTAGSQTLTSKTLTAPILSTHADYTNIATPATPGAGVLRVYSKSDSRLYRVDSTGLEVAIGGGLDPVERSTTLNPAVVGTLYVCNTSAGGFTITLPTGSSKASIGFLDARETFATNNLTIAPATGQAIDGQAVNETLVLDVSGSWVILNWSVSDSRWVIQSAAPGSSNQAIVQNGNVLGATMTVGTNDNFGVDIRTNGTTKVSVGTAGDVTVGPNASTARNLNVNGSFRATHHVEVVSTNITAEANKGVLDFTTVSSQGTRLISYGASAGTAGEFRFIQRSSDASVDITSGSVSNAGAWTFPLIHNITTGNLNSGRYTPTLTGVTNIVSAGTAASCHYTRVGNIVTVAISISTITTTSAGASTQLDASLPIASNLTGFSDALGGGGVVRLTATISSAPVVVEANATNDRFSFYWVSPVTTAVSLYITAQYEVK